MLPNPEYKKVLKGICHIFDETEEHINERIEEICSLYLKKR